MLRVDKPPMGSGIHFRRNFLVTLYMRTALDIGMDWHFKKN